MTRNIKEQVRRNAVALISLVVAITSLSYNTWRNEHSEFNRNQRQASFQILLTLGELQELVFHSIYDPDFINAGNARTGWALVLTLQDLSQVIEGEVSERAADLHGTWGDHWRGIQNQASDSEAAVNDAIAGLRNATLTRLAELD